jgi:hypothetical protein
MRLNSWVLFIPAVVFATAPLRAAVLYTGGTYSQDFDSLPVDAPNNALLETTPYANGWQDDATTVAGDHISLPGWYLFHPTDPGTEDGSSGFQRFRMGNGGSNTGSFYGYAADATSPADNSEKALGSLASNTITPGPVTGPPAVVGGSQYMGVRLTNGTSDVLTEFTLTYNGEQWRNDAAPAAAEKLVFEYSLAATALQTGVYLAAPALDFTAPVTATNGTIDGNVAGRVNNITATVTGLAWLPGADLWLRWSDENNSGSDDGLAIDDVRFSAQGVPEPATVWLSGGALVFAAGVRRRKD